MRDICMCLSSIAVIEIPMNMWDDFVQMMCGQDDQEENEGFKMAAVQCLGYVVEDLMPTNNVGENHLMLIWNTMLNQTKSQNVEMLKIVSQTLVRLAPSSKKHFGA